MPLKTSAVVPVLKRIGEANWWGVTEIQIATPIAGALSVTVTVQARKLDGLTQLWAADPERITVEGAELDALMADAWTRALAAGKAGAIGGSALYAGIRDAVYAALQTQGVIPVGAAAE